MRVIQEKPWKKEGRQRVRQFFALFPVTIDLGNGNVETRWLETVTVVEEYSAISYYTGTWEWRKIKFLNVDKANEREDKCPSFHVDL